MTFVVAGLLLGVAGSTHCVAMCGPFMLLAAGGRGSHASILQPLTRSIWHHGGRIAMYGMLGLAAGSAGHVLADAGLRQWVSIVMGAALVTSAALAMAGGRIALPGLRWSGAVTAAIRRLARGVRRDHPGHRMLLGMLNGLLPCGLLYGALLAAVGLGQASAAGAFMVGFGVGSVPALLLVVVTLTGKPAATSAFRRVAPLATAVVGVLLILRGFTQPALHGHAVDVASVTTAQAHLHH